jgi:circadian clock protein KaiC
MQKRKCRVGELDEDRREATGDGAAWHLDPTGVPQLDEVLGGGIRRGTAALIVGAPGSGKTTLAAQMAFAAGRLGRRALFFTALSESTGKIVAHLQTYRFFDDELVGGNVRLFSLTTYLVQGAAAALEMIAGEARREQASLVVLDGLSGLRDAIGGAQAARRFLYDLGTTLGMLGATTIVTCAGASRESADYPEMTTADMVIGLHYALHGVRAHRAFEVIKVRGAALLPGLHGLDLGERGVTVYPRLEARVARDAKAARGDESRAATRPLNPAGRAAFDLQALDMLLEGGLTPRTSTLVLGSPGVGKTLLGLQFALAGVRVGESTVMLSLLESEEDLLQKAAPFGQEPELRRVLAPDGGLTLLRYPSVERDADVLAEEFLAAIDGTDARRVIIDSLGELERAVIETSGPERVAGFFAALLEALRLRNITTILIRETGVVASVNLAHKEEKISLLAANVLWLQQVTYQGRLHRVLSVPKMRFSAHDFTVREYGIRAPRGFYVLTLEESTPGLLASISGQAGYATRPEDDSPTAP